jgi:hypothetical protein
MKTKILIYFFLIFISTKSFAEISLYIKGDQEGRPINEMYSLLSKFKDEYPDKNIVYYVHGRNKDVASEITTINKMEEAYNVKVVMLHWDAYSTLLSRPVGNAHITAPALYETLKDLERFEEDNQDYVKSHSIAFLCHSMGNLVLQFMMEDYYLKNEPQSKLFSNFVSVAADIPMKDHQEWLEQFHFAKSKYILMNNHDAVLLLSYALDLTEKNYFDFRLGLGFSKYPGNKDEAKGKIDFESKYIDLSPVLGSEHGYHHHTEIPVIKNFFTRLLNGKEYQDVSKSNSKNKNIFTVSK